MKETDAKIALSLGTFSSAIFIFSFLDSTFSTPFSTSLSQNSEAGGRGTGEQQDGRGYVSCEGAPPTSLPP